jgi:hypothetical protein
VKGNFGGFLLLFKPSWIFWLKSCGICSKGHKDFLSYRINSRKGNLKAASAWLSPKQTAIKGSTSEDS